VTEWWAELRELNALPVATTFLEDVVASFASSCIEEARAQVLDANGALGPEPRDPVAKAFRRRVYENKAVLAPIAADPVRESRENFLARARNHFDARAVRGKTLGYRKVSPKPSLLTTHLDWLVRFQLKGEAFAQIAAACGSVGTRQTVDAAVRSLARLLELTLRPTPRGGARPRPRGAQSKK
jgi:hypothetical protein